MKMNKTICTVDVAVELSLLDHRDSSQEGNIIIFIFI